MPHFEESEYLELKKSTVEIYNPGSFPEGLTPEDFIKGSERSYLRNPLIAEMLYKTKDIEKWGSGFKRISDDCREYGVKVTFQILKTGFLVTFYREELEENGERSEKTREKMLALIKENTKITTAELAELLFISVKGVEYHIANMKKENRLKRIGPDKGGPWEVTN